MIRMHSCAGDSFAGHLGLYHGESLVVSILVAVLSGFLSSWHMRQLKVS